MSKIPIGQLVIGMELILSGIVLGGLLVLIYEMKGWPTTMVSLTKTALAAGVPMLAGLAVLIFWRP